MSSKRRVRRNSCGSKLRYETFLGANNALFGFLRRINRGKGYLHVYKCDFCNSYHIGHAPERIRKAIQLSLEERHG